MYFKHVIKNKGTFVMNEDWDYLIILDACRYDMFKKVNYLDGKLEYRISRGSCTNEFLNENFKNKKFPSIIYITGNPLVNYHIPDSFAKIVPVWRDGWNEEIGTVLPSTMLDYTLEINKKFPYKRLIIHFVQPHYPFIGKVAQKTIGKHEGILSRNMLFGESDVKHGKQMVWNLIKQGKIDKKTAWEAYEENLYVVLQYVEQLVRKLEGKIVISSDHGNLFGERIMPLFIKKYGHPCSIYVENLLKVPWFIIEKGTRKKTIGSKMEETAKDTDVEMIKDRLRGLGYY
ncbi:MAG: hypothetical protein B5M53_10290 [Candidatus Cloacimonas sp. 4484_209]|nr:MAG: hypothetical protein B5M53_10290 [Candidatus Cloacimonas sp. 4484_209]